MAGPSNPENPAPATKSSKPAPSTPAMAPSDNPGNVPGTTVVDENPADYAPGLQSVTHPSPAQLRKEKEQK